MIYSSNDNDKETEREREREIVNKGSNTKQTTTTNNQPTTNNQQPTTNEKLGRWSELWRGEGERMKRNQRYERKEGKYGKMEWSQQEQYPKTTDNVDKRGGEREGGRETSRGS
jgi:hypothetical protein